MEMLTRVSVVGAGLIGSSWAALFASKGMSVRCFDSRAEVREISRSRIERILDDLSRFGLVSERDRTRASTLIEFSDELRSAVRDAQYVQESVAERYDVKKAVLAGIDEFAPREALIASSSSGLLMSRLQAVLRYPERSLIAHPFNPPHLIPLVELVPGAGTAPEVLLRARTFLESLGKCPILLRKEIPGHVANRLQAALWREAISLVLDGVASVEDVDRAVVAGPGLRWAIHGPHMLFHLGGGPGGIRDFIDHVGSTWGDLWRDMEDWEEIPDDAVGILEDGIMAESRDLTSEQIATRRDRLLAEIMMLMDSERSSQEPEQPERE